MKESMYRMAQDGHRTNENSSTDKLSGAINWASLYLPNTERVGETSGDGGGPLLPSRARTFFRGGFSWMLSFISLCFHKNRKILTLIRCNEEERRER